LSKAGLHWRSTEPPLPSAARADADAQDTDDTPPPSNCGVTSREATIQIRSSSRLDEDGLEDLLSRRAVTPERREGTPTG